MAHLCRSIPAALTLWTKSLSVRLVDGLMWMGWDGLHFVDGMAHIMLIPHFVWLVESEGWDGKCLAYNL
jgi:hypothetical protein